jgi:transposase InsO family protein
VNLFNHLLRVSRYLNRYQLIKESCYSKSQLYLWLKHGVHERKVRECKPVSKNVVKSAIEVIWKYPHFGASKGQCYMIYYQLGYIPQHLYKCLKKVVKSLIFQEVSKRKLLPERTSYKHEIAMNCGEIWAEDFTELRVFGKKFYAALVIDVALPHYLGATASIRADNEMVQAPVDQALKLTGGKGPERFLISDNGPQYVSTRHGDFLDKLDIIQKRIPSCKPEYNGSIECGIKEFKNVFYNVWCKMVKLKVSDVAKLKEKELLLYVQLGINETIRRMNEEIPRPGLKGVTPGDVLKGIARERREINRKYLEMEQRKKEVIEPWNRKDWGMVKKHLFKETINNLELLTKFCFFLKRPLRKLANLEREVLGN